MCLQPAVIVASHQESLRLSLYHLKTYGKLQNLRVHKFDGTQQKKLPMLWDLLTVGCYTVYQVSPSSLRSNVSITICEDLTMWCQHVFYIVLRRLCLLDSGCGLTNVKR